MNLTPKCPSYLFRYETELGGVNIVCYLEHIPFERGSRDAYGSLNEPDVEEDMCLSHAYIRGTDIDIVQLLLHHLITEIETKTLKELKNDDR